MDEGQCPSHRAALSAEYRRGLRAAAAWRFYRVRLGVLGVQRTLRLSGPLLRGTWAALRGWRTLLPVNSRIPMSVHRASSVGDMSSHGVS